MNDNMVIDFEITDAKETGYDTGTSILRFCSSLRPDVGLGDRGWVSGKTFSEPLYVEIEGGTHGRGEVDPERASEFEARVLAKGTKVHERESNPSTVSAMDQAGAALRSIAPACSQFYDALRKEGRTRAESALIVGAWVVLNSSDSAEEQNRARRMHNNG